METASGKNFEINLNYELLYLTMGDMKPVVIPIVDVMPNTMPE